MGSKNDAPSSGRDTLMAKIFNPDEETRKKLPPRPDQMDKNGPGGQGSDSTLAEAYSSLGG